VSEYVTAEAGPQGAQLGVPPQAAYPQEVICAGQKFVVDFSILPPRALRRLNGMALMTPQRYEDGGAMLAYWTEAARLTHKYRRRDPRRAGPVLRLWLKLPALRVKLFTLKNVEASTITDLLAWHAGCVRFSKHCDWDVREGRLLCESTKRYRVLLHSQLAEIEACLQLTDRFELVRRGLALLASMKKAHGEELGEACVTPKLSTSVAPSFYARTEAVLA
jgi:hypothetical protein